MQFPLHRRLQLCYPKTIMGLIKPYTLTFREKTLEQAFSKATLTRTRLQGRTAILVGMFVYLLSGMLDQWFVPAELIEQVWRTRLTALCIPTIVMAVTFTPWFAGLRHLLLAAVGLAAGIGVICIQIFIPLDGAQFYYPIMVLVTFYTYNFIGTRFVFALCVDVLLLLIYNQIFGNTMHYPPHILAGHDFMIVSANLIGGSAGYLAELGRKILYLRERELEEQRQYHQMRALHDGLTGLPNRELLYDRITQAMAKTQREGSKHCGIFLDLDGFKEINDTLSHEVGDHVLRQVGKSLTSTVRSIDTVARIGGDEFFILALDIGTEQAAANLAKKLSQALAKPLPGIPENIRISISIGVCLFPYPGMTVSDMIHRADEAMYQIKNNGKGTYAVASQPKAAMAPSPA